MSPRYRAEIRSMTMFYQRFTVLMMIVKLLMSVHGFTKFTCFDPDVIVPPAQVFYSSAACANVLGKDRPVWLFKGVLSGSKLNNAKRLLTVLRLLLLIASGDIETNPGPPPVLITSFPQGVPEPDNSIQSVYPCAQCGADTDASDCIQCEYCLRWEHNHCSNLTRSMCKEIAKYPNIIYLCNKCESVGIMTIFRRLINKFLERTGLSLGKLLDTYDNIAAKKTTDAQTQTDPCPPEVVAQPERNETPEVVAQPERNEPCVITLDVEDDPVIVKGRRDPMSNFYPFQFKYDGLTYRSLEHAYQSLKAIMCGEKSLAWRIRHAQSPQAAKWLADQLPRISMKKQHDLMFQLLKAKVGQCFSFRKCLRETSFKKIFHSTYKDTDLYWCTGLRYDDIEGHRHEFCGLNVFGRMLEEIRDEHLLDEENYETRVQYLEASNFVVILYDGEENFYRDQNDSDFYRRGSGYHRYH
jgi:ribA/ribD-fused uncharacterized protein